MIIPTYINETGGKSGFLVGLLGKSGAGFKRQFDMESYIKFFEDAGHMVASLDVVEGRMPCAVIVT